MILFLISLYWTLFAIINVLVILLSIIIRADDEIILLGKDVKIMVLMGALGPIGTISVIVKIIINVINNKNFNNKVFLIAD